MPETNPDAPNPLLGMPPGIPTWAWLLMGALGVGTTGVGGSVFGAQQVAADVEDLQEDLADLEAKVDKLDEGIDALNFQLMRLQILKPEPKP